ncbi:hypothetical protein HK103_002535 [Boothiomyces macroporosus]|uniref:non-specific serine/threonine protein kinase n=1 Tax=Boothiomyces macroporosus TaxID=261099 RepID=A0AAD5UIS1_9FUNG|nr:hypothetical protein HK103_002535 [Boothiomyces macroporosus]
MCDLYQKKGLNEKVDIWALGVLLYKVMYYTTPFEETGKMAILNGRYIIPTLPIYSDDLKSLVRMMLEVDPERRPDIYQVYERLCAIRHMPYNLAIKPKPLNLNFEEKKVSDNSIFREVSKALDNTPQQNIKVEPMRRGRPVKSPSIDKMSTMNSSTNLDDLFDGSPFNNSSKNLNGNVSNPSILDFQSISTSNSMNFPKPLSKQPSANNFGNQNTNSSISNSQYDSRRISGISMSNPKSELPKQNFEQLIDLDNLQGNSNAMKPPLSHQSSFQNSNSTPTADSFVLNPKRVSGYNSTGVVNANMSNMQTNGINFNQGAGIQNSNQMFNSPGTQYFPSQQLNPALFQGNANLIQNRVPSSNTSLAYLPVQVPLQPFTSGFPDMNFGSNTFIPSNQGSNEYNTNGRQRQSQTTTQSANQAQFPETKFDSSTFPRPSQSQKLDSQQPFVPPQSQMLIPDPNTFSRPIIPGLSRPTSISQANTSPNAGDFPLSQGNFVLPPTNSHRISQSFQSGQFQTNPVATNVDELFGSKPFIPEGQLSQPEIAKTQSRLSMSAEIPKRESKVSALAKQFESLSAEPPSTGRKSKNEDDPWTISSSGKPNESSERPMYQPRDVQKNHDRAEINQDKPPPKPPRNRLSMNSADSPHNPFK